MSIEFENNTVLGRMVKIPNGTLSSGETYFDVYLIVLAHRAPGGLTYDEMRARLSMRASFEVCRSVGHVPLKSSDADMLARLLREYDGWAAVSEELTDMCETVFSAVDEWREVNASREDGAQERMKAQGASGIVGANSPLAAEIGARRSEI